MSSIEFVMTHSPLIVGPNLSVASLVRTLVEHRADGACVVDGGQLVGVVTAMDLVIRLSEGDVDDVPSSIVHRKRHGATVRDLMTWPAHTVGEDEDLAHVASKMADEHLSMIPVVDETGALVGVVTRQRVLEAFATGLAGE